MVGYFTSFLRRRDGGAALVEAALVLPLLLMLTLGIWSTARAWNVHNVLDHAAREAARRGAPTADATDSLAVARGEVVAASLTWNDVNRCASIIKGGATIDADGGGGGGYFPPNPCLGGGADPTTDDRVQVSLEIPNYQLDFVFFSVTVNLRAQAVSRLEPGA